MITKILDLGAVPASLWMWGRGSRPGAPELHIPHLFECISTHLEPFSTWPDEVISRYLSAGFDTRLNALCFSILWPSGTSSFCRKLCVVRRLGTASLRGKHLHRRHPSCQSFSARRREPGEIDEPPACVCWSTCSNDRAHYTHILLFFTDRPALRRGGLANLNKFCWLHRKAGCIAPEPRN